MLSYYGNERNAQKENNMKFDSTYKNSRRADYEQFAKFINGQNMTRESAKAVPTMAYEPTANKRPIGMVYGESQEWKSIFDIELGLTKGTIFEELDLPFNKSSCNGGRSCRG